MEGELENISNISGVGYLLVRLGVATRNKDTRMQEAVIKRLNDIGVLCKPKVDEHQSYKNLRFLVGRILRSNTPYGTMQSSIL